MNHVLQPQEETATPGDPQVLGLDDDSTQDALDALSSETARQLFSSLYDEPHTPTELREAVGTSLQNVHYHLEKLEAAELVQPVGTRYSEKGKEMTVYGPASEAVVFMAGNDESKSLLRRALARFVGALGLLAGGTLLVDRLIGGERAAQEATGTGPMIASEDTAQTAGEAASTIDPALVFFLGGVFVLAVVCGWWAYRTYR
jgi:DNA-binding transcriptional ArsR family regulator